MELNRFWCLASQSSKRPCQTQHLWLIGAHGRREDQYSPPLAVKYPSFFLQHFSITITKSNSSIVSFHNHSHYHYLQSPPIYSYLIFASFHIVCKYFGKLRIRPWWACWGLKVLSRKPWCSCFFGLSGRSRIRFLRFPRRNQPTQIGFFECRAVPHRRLRQKLYILCFWTTGFDTSTWTNSFSSGPFIPCFWSSLNSGCLFHFCYL